MLLLQTALHGV